jgi:NADH-quinone oxidoreductase subunit J
MKLGALFSVVLALELAYALSGLVPTPFRADTASAVSNVATIGTVLFTTYSFAFEATSILILVAMVGAVVIAGKPRSER